MIQQVPDIILSKLDLYYAIIDKNLNIVFLEEKLREYLVFNSDSAAVLDLFPELFGIEDEIIKVSNGESEEYKLSELNRSEGKDICFNLHIFPYQDKCVLIIVEDISREIRFRQSLQQNRNEIQLLQNTLIEKNADLENNNRMLTQVHDEVVALNTQLEAKVRARTKETEEKNLKLTRLFDQTVQSLSRALEKRDEYTAGHQQRVAALSCAIAQEMGLDADTIDGIRFAGNLHDIGKIYVPIEFLTKPSRLTKEELSIIKMHPLIGFEILKDIEFMWPVASIVLQHHERIDGNGYPFGLEGNNILIQSKILAVADNVEAMATNRPYRVSPGMKFALDEIIKNKGTYFDPDVVDICVDLITQKKFSF